MEIKRVEEKNKGILIAYFDEIEAGKLMYTWRDDSELNILHTEVHPEFGGQGIGKKLVLHVAEFARNKKSKIKPMCTYAKAVFDKTPEIQDVLD